MTINNQAIGPGHRDYLPPNESPTTPDCGASALESTGVAWVCTREHGHDGDHAAHADLGRASDVDPVMMMVRWG